MELFDGASYRINIQGMDSTLVVDSYRGIVKANIVDASDFVIVDYDSRTFYGELVGNVSDNLGNIIVDTEAATFKGNLKGDIINDFGLVVYDSINNNLHVEEIYANILLGDVSGNILNKKGFLFYNADEDSVSADTVSVNTLKVIEPINATVIGTLLGDVTNSLGDVILNTEERSIFVNYMQGDLLSKIDGISYNHLSNTFYGNFSGNLINERVNINNLTIGSDYGGNLIIYSETDIEDDFNALSIYNFKDSLNFSSFTLSRSRGTRHSPNAVLPGDNLNSILFSAQYGNNFSEKTEVGLIGARIPADGQVLVETPGELVFMVNHYNGEFKEALVIDANGNTDATLKELKVNGNTGNVPSNTSNAHSWLEVLVNGNKMFIPLYQ